MLHDLTLDYEHTIVDIHPQRITGREIGGTEIFWDWNTSEMRPRITEPTINFIEYTKEGKTLRSSTLFLRDEDGNPSVCIAINEDITKSLELERYLHSRNRVDTDQPNEDKYRGDVNDMLQHLMDQAQLMVGKNSAHMTKEDKLRYLEFLDKHGAFLITYSNAQVARLNISQFSLYNYLRMIRGGKTARPSHCPWANELQTQKTGGRFAVRRFSIGKKPPAGWRGGLHRYIRPNYLSSTEAPTSSSFFLSSSLVLGDLLLDGAADALDLRLGFRQAQVGDLTDGLDDLDLLIAEAGQNDVKLGLLLGGSSSAGHRSGGNSSSGGNAEHIFDLVHELGQLEDGHSLDLFDHSSDFFASHGNFPPK